MKKKKMIKCNNRGFTLIELIIAIAMLAVITIPLLSYFSDAAKHNAQNRRKHNASIEAQNILESLKSTSYSLNDESVVLTNDSSWVSDVAQAVANGDYTLKKKDTVNIDNAHFTVTAKITPYTQRLNTDSTVAKDYEKSVIGTMDTSKDVLIADRGTVRVMAKEYFMAAHQSYCDGHSLTPNLTESIVDKCLDCTIIITAKQDTSKTSNTRITAELKYTFSDTRNGGVYPAGIDGSTSYKDTVNSTSIPKDKLENIYLFYSPTIISGVSTITDNVVLVSDDDFNNVAQGGNTSPVNLYIVAQNSVNYNTADADVPAGYQKRAQIYTVSISTESTSGSGKGYFGAKVGRIYANLAGGDDKIASSDLTATPQYSLVDKEDVARLADIEVNVYQEGNTTDPFVTVTGSKILE